MMGATMQSVLFQPGRTYEFRYPRHNFHGVLSAQEPRRVLVTAVRDLVEDPIERETFDLQPLLRRGRYLVTGQDLDKNAERSFYVESIRGARELELANAG